MLISIYPFSGGERREMQAHAEIAASGPFDSPEIIAGKLVTPPSPADRPELVDNEVLYEGEVYCFRSLSQDGSFLLKKAW